MKRLLDLCAATSNQREPENRPKIGDNGNDFCVGVQVSESSLVVVVGPYRPGRAPVLLVNHSTHRTVAVQEEAVDGDQRPPALVLAPQQACYFTWSRPDAARTLSWSDGEHQVGAPHQISRSSSHDPKRGGGATHR